MRRLFFLLALLAASTLTPGCLIHHHHRHPHGMPPGQAKKMVHHKARHHPHVHGGVAVEVGITP